MALKVWLNNSMKKIDTSLHKPVVFLNGDKYRLDKAYTFVNGVKHQVWGENGVVVDYIKSDGVLGGGTPFAVGENWLNCYNNNNIYRIDISNLSNPTLIRQIAYGNVQLYNNYQSTSTDKIFGAWNSNTNTNYKLKMDNSTGEIVVLSSGNITASSSNTSFTSFMGITNDYFVNVFSDLYSMRPVVMYNRYIYWNNVRKYDTNVIMPYYYFQDNENSFIGVVGHLYRFSLSGTTDLNVSLPVSSYANTLVNASSIKFPFQIFDDGTYVYTSGNTVIYKRAIADLGTNIATYTESDIDNYKLRLLGQIGSYLYCLRIPKSSSLADPVIKLILLNISDLSSAYEQVLPNDPFDEYSGATTFWMNSLAMPQISETGFIAFGMYESSGLKMRIARFSAII